MNKEMNAKLFPNLGLPAGRLLPKTATVLALAVMLATNAATAANVANVNLFNQLYSGSRNDFSANLGFSFVPSQAITVSALGRGVPAGTTLKTTHLIQLFHVSDSALVASNSVDGTTPKDSLGYAMAPITPVTLTNGDEYALVCSETAGDGDGWMDAAYAHNHSSLVAILGGCYGGGPGVMPPIGHIYGTDAAYDSPTFDIVTELLTVTGITATNKMYDATTAATINVGAANLVGVSSGDNVTLDTTLATGVFQDKNAGSNKTVTVTGLALAGADAWKYELAPVTATANISRVPITVTADPQTKVVGQPDPVLTYQVTSGTLLPGDSLIGNIVQAVGSNYIAWEAEWASYSNGVVDTWSVIPDPLASGGAALVALGATYTGSPPDSTASWKLIFNTPGSYNLYVRYWCNPPGSTANNSYWYPASFGNSPTFLTSAANSVPGPQYYTFLQEAGSFVVNPGDVGRPLTFEVATRETEFYLDRLVLSTNSSLNSVQFNALPNTPAGLTRLPGEAIGTYAIQQGTLTGSGNYTITFVGADLTITAPVFVAFNVTGIVAENKVYDGLEDAVLDVTNAALVGVLPGDVVSLDTSGAVGAFGQANVGTNILVTISGLALTGADAYKYQLVSPITTNANITRLPITVTADAKTKVEGYPDPALTYQITSGSLVSPDNFTGALTRAPGETVGTYVIGQGMLALTANYSLTYVPANLTITPITEPLNLFFQLYSGHRNDFTAFLGFSFTVSQPLQIDELGRGIPPGTTLNVAHLVQLFKVSDASLVASATVTTNTPTDSLGYLMTPITPVTLAVGEEYAIYCGETAGDGDGWMDAAHVSNHSVLVTILGGCYGEDPTHPGIMPPVQHTYGVNASYDSPTFRILSVSAGAPSVPRINIKLQTPSTLVISGTNGAPGTSCRVLSATNLATPRTSWVPVSTNTFDGAGTFAVTNTVSGGDPRRFYLISVP